MGENKKIRLLFVASRLRIPYPTLYRVVVRQGLVEYFKEGGLLYIYEKDIETIKKDVFIPKGFVRVTAQADRLGFSRDTVLKYLKLSDFEYKRIRSSYYMREKDVVPLGNYIFKYFYRTKKLTEKQCQKKKL